MSVPSDILLNPVSAEQHPLVREQRKGASDNFLASGKKLDGGVKKSLCAVPVIQEQVLHQQLFEVATRMKKPKVKLTL